MISHVPKTGRLNTRSKDHSPITITHFHISVEKNNLLTNLKFLFLYKQRCIQQTGFVLVGN